MFICFSCTNVLVMKSMLATPASCASRQGMSICCVPPDTPPGEEGGGGEGGPDDAVCQSHVLPALDRSVAVMLK